MQTERYNKIFEWVISDKYRIHFHVMFWLFVYSDEVLSLIGITDNQGISLVYVLINLAVDLVFVYTNLYYLLPKFLLNNQIWYYIFFTIITIFISLELRFTLTFPMICTSCPNTSWSSPFTMLVQDVIKSTLVLGMALGMHIVRRFLRNQEKMQELQTAGLKTELAFLKQQINPHFLFNSLNNIYVMNRKSPQDASESILLLSDLLRYQLYDCAKDEVHLKGEIDYLKNYLQLDKIRKSNAKVDFQVNGVANGTKIAPFLFIPFVENAVKHGLSLDQGSFINIHFDIQQYALHFSCENSKPPRPLNVIKGGIGLTNVERRLKLLYPDRHTLVIDNNKGSYKVELSLDLDN
ncbi:MAG: histidine kinase [Bacteroidota bacterium]